MAGATRRRQREVFVDTAPLMEKPLGQRAGVGWQGKHTNLVSRTQGSWTFPRRHSHRPDAGRQRGRERSLRELPGVSRCLSTQKRFPRRTGSDARRCISYLTIEHQGPIPDAFRKRSATVSMGVTTARGLSLD